MPRCDLESTFYVYVNICLFGTVSVSDLNTGHASLNIAVYRKLTGADMCPS